MDFPTLSDLQRIGQNEALARQGLLTVSAIQRDGSDANILNAASAAMGDECIGQLTDVAASLLLDSATGSDLDRLVYDRYGIVRNPAAAALGSVVFTLPTANPAAFTIPVGTQVSTATGQNYVTTAAATFPVSSVGPITVAIRSTLAGSDQQAAAQTITGITGAIPGSPAGLVVNNPLATAGAADDESDQALRARARAFFVNARRGTLAAITAAALAVPGVVTAATYETLNANGQPGRQVNLVVSDAFTDQLANLGVNPPTYQQQSQVLAQTVFSGMDDVRPAGTYVQVTVAQVILLPITLALTFTADADIPAVIQAAVAVLVNYQNANPPGGGFSYDAAIAQLQTVNGLIISGNEIVSPPGSVEANALQVLRTTAALIAPVSAVPGVLINVSQNPDSF